MKRTARITMSDIAQAAGVTLQTVSRAFRNASDISEETRERVLNVAREMNYVKNDAARLLRCRKSNIIAVVYDTLVNVYFSIMINYFQAKLKALGYEVLMLTANNRWLTREAYEFAVAQNVAGIVSFLEPNHEIHKLIEHFSVPVLLFGRRTDEDSVDFICTDDFNGGRVAARYLLEKGCKRPLFLGLEKDLLCVQDRYNGFCEVIEAAGLEKPEFYSITKKQPLETYLPEKFAEQDTAPDALFCFNDVLALEALSVLEDESIPFVPTIGFDAVQQELRMPNKIPSVGTDKKAMAERAAQMIVEIVENKREKKSGIFVDVALFFAKKAKKVS